MANQRPRRNTPLLWSNLKIAAFVVAGLWSILIVDVLLPVELMQFGIVPREVEGLWGIPIAPVLHANAVHLSANSGALFVLLTISLVLSRKVTAFALVIVVAVAGAGTWLFGAPNSVHIGASGVIFGLIGLLLFAGVFRREAAPLFASLLVLVLYGGALWSFLRLVPSISWSGHFWGFVGGAVAAYTTRRQRTGA